MGLAGCQAGLPRPAHLDVGRKGEGRAEAAPCLGISLCCLVPSLPSLNFQQLPKEVLPQEAVAGQEARPGLSARGTPPLSGEDLR